MRCISERNKVGNTVLYEATVLKYNDHYHSLLLWDKLLSSLISLKRKKIFRKEKRHSSVFWTVFQISKNYFSLHMHFDFKMFFELLWRKYLKICTISSALKNDYNCLPEKWSTVVQGSGLMEPPSPPPLVSFC